ncbi:MAG: hypothetical protein FJ125_10870, partial [Deltaproteobacteria bacterium]|nr:hypothetical protein [Deltaproteobacteria bacterium]
APPSRADTGHLARDPAWRGQYVWQDAWHDARTDFAGFDQRIDITELRVTADLQFVYFLIRMRDIDQSSWDGAPQVRIAVDRDRIPGSGRTILGFDESDCLTRTSGRAAWEYLILTRFGSSEGPPDQLFVLDGSFRQQSDPRHLAAISEATDVIELRVPWERIGGRPGQPPYTDLPVAFTVVSTLADHEDRSWWVGGWPNNVLDAVTNYGEPAIDCGFWPCNTWRDVQDEVVDYHFTVHFHLDPDIEPASPLLVQRVMSAPAAGDSEWIALQERRGAPFPLDGIKLGDEESVGGDEGMLRFPDEAVITPGGVVVIAGDAAAFQRKYGMLPHFTWGVAFPGVKQLLPYLGWSTGSISLKDGGEEVLLLDDQDTVLDAVVFGYGSYHGVAARAVAASVDRYLARRPDREDSNDCSGDFQVSPFISAIADVAGVEDEVVAPVSFVVGDEETPAAGLQVAAGSSNPLLLPQGSLVLRGEGANRTLQLVPAADRSGTAVVIVTVTDADGAQAAKRFVLAIAPVNDPPACTAAPTIDGVLLAGQLLTAREGSWNDDRDTTPGKLTYTYHWQRASDLRGQDAASIEGATAKTYSLGFADLHAFVRVQVTATDDGEGTPGRQTTEASPWYAVGNSPPVIDESEAVAVACDEDGSPAPFALTLHAVDADADALFWDIAQAPAHGAASTAGQTGRSMSIVYQPSPDYHGPDSFVVRVRDGNGVRFFGGEDTITVTIDVRPVNDPPQVVAQGDRQTAEGQVVTLAPAATFSDVDGGDAHTALIDWGDGIVEPGTVEP